GGERVVEGAGADRVGVIRRGGRSPDLPADLARGLARDDGGPVTEVLLDRRRLPRDDAVIEPLPAGVAVEPLGRADRPGARPGFVRKGQDASEEERAGARPRPERPRTTLATCHGAASPGEAGARVRTPVDCRRRGGGRLAFAAEGLLRRE